MMRKLAWLVLMILSAPPVNGYRLPETVVPRHYDILLAPDLATGALSGRESIEVRLLEPTATITLNAVGLELRSAAVIAGNERRPARVSMNAEHETATLTLDSPLPAGEARIEIEFAGRVRDDLRGLYRTKTAERSYATTQFQATYARMAFPCFDEPAFKATFDLSLVVDEGDTAISNGRIVADTPGPSPGKHTLRFSTSPRMSTYLVAVAIGDFACVEGGAGGIPIRVCAVPAKKELGRFALRAAESFVPFFNRYYGIRYPFGKLDMVALPDYEWGGMENTASIFYRERGLLLDEKTASVNARRSVASLVAHEIAHQWFGDLVTLKWWDDVWLNEGFATAMTHKPLTEWDPAWDQSLDEAQATAAVLGVDSLQATRPIRQNGASPAEIKELFDGIAYQKGAALLRMIEAWVGPEVYREGVHSYLAKYANGNAKAEDLWSELARVSKRPVDKVMASFVDQPGAPLVSIETRCAEGSTRVTLSQQRFFEDPRLLAAGSPEVWAVPVCLRRPDGEAVCELLTERSRTFELPGCGPWVLANAGARGYYRTAYTDEALREIAGSAGTALSPAEQIALLDDQWALVRAGRADVSGSLRLAESLSGSRERVVLEMVVSQLDSIGEILVEPAQRGPYQAWVRGLLQPAARELGWTVAPGDSDDRKALRSLVLGALGRAGDAEVLAEARRLVDRYLADSASVDPSLLDTAFALSARHGDAALYDAFMAKLDTAKTPEEYYRYLYSLTAFRDEALIRRSLDLALSPRMREQDLANFTGALIGNPASRSQAWTFLKARWPELQTKVISFGGRGAVSALGAFCDAGAADDIERFFAANRAPGAERALKRSLEGIRNCVALKELQRERLAAWIEERGGRGAS
jgi:aminopeptidase N